MLSLSRIGVLAGALATFVACTASPTEESDSSDQDIRIKPAGTETLSTLILQLPTGTCLPGGNCAKPLASQAQFTLDGTAMTLGTGLRVIPGPHTLAVGTTSTTVTLVAGATRTMTVPVIRRICTNGNGGAAPTTDFGRVPSLRYANCPGASLLDGKPLQGNVNGTVFTGYTDDHCVSIVVSSVARNQNCAAWAAGNWTVGSVIINGVCTDIPNKDLRPLCESWVAGGPAAIGAVDNSFAGYTAVVPGTYTFPIENNAGGFDNQDRAVAEGDTSDLSFTLPQIGTVPDRFDTVLKFQDARELPDAAAATITSSCERNYSVPQSAAGNVTLKAFQFAACSYTFTASGRTVALTQSAANNVNLHRIDVDDVVVTREDNSTYVVKGTYELYFGGQKVAGPYNTNSGIDALDGDYELVVKYTTAEGQKSNHYTLNF